MLTSNQVLDGGANGVTTPTVFLPRGHAYGAGRDVVLLMAGSGYTWPGAFERTVLYSLAEQITAAGFPVVTTDTFGDQFGNAKTRAAIESALAYGSSGDVGTKSGGKIHLAGFSMGGCNVLSWAGNNPSRVASITTWCALTDLRTAAASLGTAYPGGYVEGTHGATNNPATMAAAGKYAGIPTTMCYSSNDPVVSNTDIVSFASTTGATLVNLGAVGHDNTVPLRPAAVAALFARLGVV